MGLDIRVMTLEAKERSSLAHRGVAALGLVALGLAWAVLLTPCLLWLAVTHLGRRLEPAVRRPAPQALKS
jgi:cytochrome c biogenesis protein CcdA